MHIFTERIDRAAVLPQQRKLGRSCEGRVIYGAGLLYIQQHSHHYLICIINHKLGKGTIYIETEILTYAGKYQNYCLWVLDVELGLKVNCSDRVPSVVRNFFCVISLKR
jgi:hypothetical protein